MADSARGLFPARITGSNGGGDYSWIEQVVGQVGDYEDSPTPRTGTTTISKANEANGIIDIPDDTIVMLKLRGVIAGNPIYDIICSAEVFGSGSGGTIACWKEPSGASNILEDSLIWQDSYDFVNSEYYRIVLEGIRLAHSSNVPTPLSGVYNPIDLETEFLTTNLGAQGQIIHTTVYVVTGSATIKSMVIGGNESSGQLVLIGVSPNNGSDTITLVNNSSVAPAIGALFNGGGADDTAYDIVLSAGQFAIYYFIYTNSDTNGGWFLVGYSAPVPSGLLGTIDGGTW